jgi:hypothetical protein
MKGQLVHSPTRINIYCYGLLNCSGAVHYCRSSILSEFCDRGSTGLKSAIDDRSTSHCRSTLIAFKCNRLARVMLLLAFLDSLGVIFVLATIGIVDCTFRPVDLRSSRFHSCVWGKAVSLPSRRSVMERKRHRFFYSYCMATIKWIE